MVLLVIVEGVLVEFEIVGRLGLCIKIGEKSSGDKGIRGEEVTLYSMRVRTCR